MKSAKIAALFLALSLLTAGTAGIAEEATHTHVYTCKYLDKDYHVYVCSQCGTQTKEKHSLTELGTCMDCNATGLSTGSGSTGSSTKKKKTQTVETAPVPSLNARWTDPDGIEMEVGIVTLGITSSTVVNEDGEEMLAETAQLVFDNSDVPEEKRFARLMAPKNGKVSIRKTEKTTSKILQKGVTGTVVVVLQVGSKCARVWYDGTVGYVQLTSLEFLQPQEPIGTAVLHYKGKTNGKKRIGIHTKMDTSSANAVSLLTGNTVVLLSRTDHWSMVEYEGKVGYVQNSYLKTEE